MQSIWSGKTTSPISSFPNRLSVQMISAKQTNWPAEFRSDHDTGDKSTNLLPRRKTDSCKFTAESEENRLKYFQFHVRSKADSGIAGREK
jgi:hypothetical protein